VTTPKKENAITIHFNAPKIPNVISAKSAVEASAYGDAVIIDVRNEDEARKTGTARGAMVMPLGKLRQKAETGDLEKVLKGRPVVLMCAGGQKAQFAAFTLAQNGIENVSFTSGGLMEWVNNGGPVSAYPRISLPTFIQQPRPAGFGFAHV